MTCASSTGIFIVPFTERGKVYIINNMSVQYNSSNKEYGFNFIKDNYIPAGKNEFYLRDEQASILLGKSNYRALTSDEIKTLENNYNYADNWQNVLVGNDFDANSIHHSSFYGLVRIGALGTGTLQYHDYSVKEGIYNSTIISCDIGSHCAIHDCAYLAHYIICSQVILAKIDEMDTTNHCKGGNGIVKDGEDESVRVWIEPLNEAGGREILPFDKMLIADAYMWTIYREDEKLMSALFDITNKSYDKRRGFYGVVGANSVIKSCRTIKDVIVGECAYIKGANKLKNLTIKSDKSSPTQIGEGVELVNGIIGYGSHIFYGCKAVRFVMGTNANLKYGARLIHSILGDNSTVSCCEVLNNLVFPGHEQHHNNSFLIATMIMGQSNMAAGATVGSNHNSRGNDGEIIAGRGFWPGLSSTLKHNSRFASYTLITKGNYPNELNIPLPFSMVIDNPQHNRLEVMPAYYWMYNMYALERNSWKYRVRDTRAHKEQHIVTDYLAPDTAQEILRALELLEEWVGKALCRTLGENESENVASIRLRGKKYLQNKPEVIKKLTIIGENLERSKRAVHIIKTAEAYRAYQNMLVMYAVKAVLEYCAKAKINASALAKEFMQTQNSAKYLKWINMGGQLVTEHDFNQLRTDIVEEKLGTWDAIHARYDELWDAYPKTNAFAGFAVLQHLFGDDVLQNWQNACAKAREIRTFMEEQVYITKLKDYTNTFRSCTYRNQKERFAVLGKVEDNSFIKTAKQETLDFLQMLDTYGV